MTKYRTLPRSIRRKRLHSRSLPSCFQIPYLQFPFIFKFFHTCPTGFLKFPRLCVGDDAHIVPANKTVFTETFGEFDGALWVDVGIDPTALLTFSRKSGILYHINRLVKSCAFGVAKPRKLERRIKQIRHNDHWEAAVRAREKSVSRVFKYKACFRRLLPQRAHGELKNLRVGLAFAHLIAANNRSKDSSARPRS